MHENFNRGDLVWIPANTPIQYLDGDTSGYSKGKTKSPSTGLVLSISISTGRNCEHLQILRFDQRISIRKKDVRKL
jgi:hypothetical protein